MPPSRISRTYSSPARSTIMAPRKHLAADLCSATLKNFPMRKFDVVRLLRRGSLFSWNFLTDLLTKPLAEVLLQLSPSDAEPRSPIQTRGARQRSLREPS